MNPSVYARAWVVAVALGAACGGSTAPLGETAPDASAPSAEASPPAPQGTCPSAKPANGGACTATYLECEYGSSPVLACNTVATCEASLWTITPPDGSPNECPRSQGLECPATFVAASTAKGQCQPFGLACDYPEGRCECGVGAGPVPTDAAAAARWNCQEPAAGCPRPRPRLGAQCSQDGLTCDYGSCVVSGGSTVKCTGGVWMNEPFACAL
jgi:hypothetical protein